MAEEMLIVNVCAMQTKDVGDYVYRVEQPAVAMGRAPGVKVVNVSTLSPYWQNLCLTSDVLVLHLMTEYDLLPIMEERKSEGRPTVYEISDNFMAIQRGTGTRSWFSDPANVAGAFQLIRLADAVQAASQGIKDRYLFLNPRFMLFENQVAQILPLAEKNTDEVVIGWGGSVGHAEDLKYIQNAVTDICAAHPRVKFAFMGDPSLFARFFSDVPEVQKIFRMPGTLSEYFDFLRSLDIGLAPMQETAYNLCRSDVKFIEYAAAGVVPVLSSVQPYQTHAGHGENSLLFENPEQLKSILSELIQNKGLRQRIGKNAHEYVRNHRTEGAHAGERIRFYKSLCTQKGAKEEVPVPLKRLDPASEAFDLDRTQAETDLRKGIELEASGHARSARDLYRKAGEWDCGYGLALFWLGYSLMRNDEPNALEWFQKALEKNPRSLRSLLCAGHVLAKKSPPQAQEMYEQALRVSSSFAPACEAIGLLYEHQLDYQNALAFYNEALKKNPFYAPAAAAMGRVYSILGDKENAGRAFRVAADMAPMDAESQFLAAESQAFLGNIKEAAQYCLRAMELDPHHADTKKLMEKLQEMAR